MRRLLCLLLGHRPSIFYVPDPRFLERLAGMEDWEVEHLARHPPPTREMYRRLWVCDRCALDMTPEIEREHVLLEAEWAANGSGRIEDIAP